MKQVSIYLLLFAVFLGVTQLQGHNTYTVNLNCSKYEKEPGEVFHLYKSINGSYQVDYCVECRCDEYDNQTRLTATCSELECPKLKCQKVIQKEGECCKSCDTSGVVNLVAHKYVTKCTQGGNTYSDLTVIPSLNSSNPCEVCYCWEGEIVCDSILRTCPKPRCESIELVWDPKYCCPSCPPSMNNIPTGQGKKCQEHGITYQDGDTWNPYYARFGVLDCYLCTCKDGKRNCKRVPCPEVRACTADDPYEDVTICCPKCSRIPKPTEQDKEKTTYQPPVIMPDPPPTTSTQCKDSCSYSVYKSVDSLKDQVAVESIVSKNADVYVWSPDLLTMWYETYTSKHFSDNFVNKRFTYIGCTTQSSVTRLHSRLSSKSRMRNLTYCQERCAEKVIELLKPDNKQQNTRLCN